MRKTTGKPESLTSEETELAQKHPETAFGIMRKLSAISTPAAHIAYQHQERFDGKGYPRNLAGQDILELARLVSAVDIFDALLADRPYRRGLSYFEACEIIKTVAGSYIDGDCMNLLLSHVALYPVGTTVQLSSGEYAVVMKVTPQKKASPWVLVLTDKSGNPLVEVQKRDMSQFENTTIVKELQGIDAFTKLLEMKNSENLAPVM